MKFKKVSVFNKVSNKDNDNFFNFLFFSCFCATLKSVLQITQVF